MQHTMRGEGFRSAEQVCAVSVVCKHGRPSDWSFSTLLGMLAVCVHAVLPLCDSHGFRRAHAIRTSKFIRRTSSGCGVCVSSRMRSVCDS